MNVVAIVQARLGSTRLPGKVMKRINNKPMIGLLIDRLKLAKKINQIIVAVPDNDSSIPLKEYFNKSDTYCEEGSEKNVLERFVKVAKKYDADTVVRITGDCPLIDPRLVDDVIGLFEQSDSDYSSNINPPTYPDGLDVEVFSSAVLYEAYKSTNNPFDLEHVTPYMRNNGLLKITNLANKIDLSSLRWTVDEDVDLKVVRKIFDSFSPKIDFHWEEVLDLYKAKPEIFNHNQDIKRNEGHHMNSGQKLWKRAKKVIPGGNMLLSKRAEMFLPKYWPVYFSKAKDCRVWDLDGSEFLDMSIMGVGTNLLGYGNSEIDDAVKMKLTEGNMSTLNCPEEVHLAEKLVEINPWADMVRFARSGGEANSIAIRIARAASGKDNVAICGYHGWHDWYLASNINSKDNLTDHLLPGLESKGVPKNLNGTVFPFNYNDFEGLERIVNDHDIGTIKMEVVRNVEPENDFLENVRKLATEKNIVLVFDECTSGFRESFGGIHMSYNIEPDIAMYGKTLGNGYAITAVVGKRAIMEAAQSTFISSTFWTERIGSVAALKSLEIMERTKSWKIVSKKGNMIKDGWRNLASKYDLPINIYGISALPSFRFKSTNNLAYKTYITQEMLKKGYLATMSVYVSTQHSDEIINDYLDQIENIFKKISDCEGGLDIMSLLDGPICHDGFARLN